MKAKTVFQKTSEGLGAQRVALLTLFVLVIGGHFLRPHTAQAAWQATACQLPPLQKTGSLAVASATDVIATDFNHDGKQDVLVLRTSPAQSQTYFGDGAGGFTLAASANGFSVLRNDEILVGEFNGDGFPDLYVRRDDGGNNRQVQVYINDGQGRFTLGAEITARVLSFLIGDVNNDGLDDVLAATSSNYTVYLANANRTFTRLPNDFGSGQSALLLDLNGDGRLDFVNVIRGAGNVGTMFIWQGNGNGTFQQMDFLSLADYVQLRKAADLNRDGRADIVATTTCSGTGTPKLYHLLNNGRGNFTARSFDLPGAPCDVAVKGVQDFTSDGFPEVALSNRRIALNDGQGGVCSLSEACCNSDFLPTINAVADFNGDNRADVVNVESFSSVAFWSSRSVTANTPPKVIAATPATIAQGSASVEILLATLSDAETPAGNLGYEVTTQPSLIVTNLRNDNGLLKGTPVIGCTTPAAVYQITVKASDTGGLSATGTLNLTVGANSAPEVGAYPTSTALARNGSTTITPAASVQDNGTTIVAVSAPTFTGNVSVNALGVVAVNQAGPAGSHSFAVTITDNCGATTKREFTVVVTDATGGGCDTPVFNEAENFNANQNPYGLTSGDFNGDGKPDLATTNIYDQTVTVLLASGNGFAKQPAIAVGVFPNAVVARDVNGDGKLDLVVVNRGSDTVTILLGNGDGTFARKGDYAVGNKSTGVAIGDFNGDGKADLILPNDGLGNAVVLDGNGDGSFAAPRYFYAGTSPQPPVVADFNRDGRDDVAFPNYSSGEVAILLGNGNGTFQSPIIIGNLGGAGVEAIAAGDLNGDGKLDIAVTNTTTNQVFTLLGDGQGGFTNGGGFATFSDYPASLVIADFTGDGKADIAVGGYGDSRVRIFKGLGNGFDNNNPLALTVGQYPLGLLAADFNGDGKPDLALANFGAGSVSVLLNGCTR